MKFLLWFLFLLGKCLWLMVSHFLLEEAVSQIRGLNPVVLRAFQEPSLEKIQRTVPAGCQDSYLPRSLAEYTSIPRQISFPILTAHSELSKVRTSNSLESPTSEYQLDVETPTFLGCLPTQDLRILSYAIKDTLKPSPRRGGQNDQTIILP